MQLTERQLVDRILQLEPEISIILAPYAGLEPGQISVRWFRSENGPCGVITPVLGVRAWLEARLQLAIAEHGVAPQGHG